MSQIGNCICRIMCTYVALQSAFSSLACSCDQKGVKLPMNVLACNFAIDILLDQGLRDCDTVQHICLLKAVYMLPLTPSLQYGLAG